jgi:hypothetical protein
MADIGVRARLDSAIAVALGITSYVSDVNGFVLDKGMCHDLFEVIEPRDALNRVILGCESNNEEMVKKSLGPRSRTALDSLVADRSWEALKAELWPGASSGAVAVGHRFEVGEGWSQPWDRPEGKALTLINPPNNPEAEVVFVDSSGSACGRRRIKFLITQAGLAHYENFVNNSDVGDLLRVVSSCAAAPEHAN